MKILIVSQYYAPEAVPLPSDLARGLAARGHSVRVLTGYPNYPRGEIFSGYRQRWRGREYDGLVEVCRVPLFADHSQSALKRLLNYSSFALSASTARRFAKGVDVVYVYATQMTAAYGPWLWRLTGGSPYVLHVQDLWPESIMGSSLVKEGYLAQMMGGILGVWLRGVYRRAAAVIGIAPTMVSTLIERGVPSEHAHLVYNWADAEELAPPTAPTAGQSARADVVYAGNVGDMQDLATAVRAAHAASDAGVTLTIVGEGVALESLRGLVTDLGATNVRFEGSVTRDRMLEVYARADYALVSLRDLVIFHGTIPSKFQAILAAGVPVISTVQGDVRAFVDRFEVGLTADAESVGSLEAAFRVAASLDMATRGGMRRRARAAYDTHFSRTFGMSRVEAILSMAAKKMDGGQ